MVGVNEYVKANIADKAYLKYGIPTINSASPDKGKCTWVCHNSTIYCKENHVTQYLNGHFKQTDIIYFGIINLLHSTGNYGLANIIFLVVLAPLMVWCLLIKSMNIQDEINLIKKR